MNDNLLAVLSWDAFTAQPSDVRGLHERDTLIISATQVDGLWVILNRYGDDIWQLGSLPATCQLARNDWISTSCQWRFERL